MPEPLARPGHAGWPARWTAALLIILSWLLVVVFAIARLRQTEGIVVAIAALAASAMTLTVTARADRDRWRTPIENMSRFVRDLTQNRDVDLPLASEPELVELTGELAGLEKKLRNPSSKSRPTRLAASQSQAAAPPRPQPHS